MKSFNTPILFLVFNRPDTTKQVFEAIRNVKPEQLFVAADGSRGDRTGEEELCKVVREIATTIDWKCEVKTLFRDENLGCGRAVSEAISWFFENVEEGIILEDDCLPDQSFFDFCAVLLDRYRNEDRIMHIGGSNFQFGKIRGAGDYYFSTLSHVWGWATWRKCWEKYSFEISNLEAVSDTQYNKVFNNNQLFIDYYKQVFDQMRNMEIDTWDYQWSYTILINNGVCVCPNVNLVKNIGFRPDGTHTLYETEWNQVNIAKSLSSFNPPSLTMIDYTADAFTLEDIMGIKALGENKRKVTIGSAVRRLASVVKRAIR